MGSSQVRSSRKALIDKKHEQAMVRRIVLIVIFCLAVITLLVLYTIPVMVRVADMWAQVRNSDQRNTNSDRMTVPLYRPLFNEFGYDATNSATLTLSGSAEAGTTVSVTQNDQTLPKVVTDNSGTFTLTSVTLQEGNNTFVAKADDGKGRISESSRPLSITLDTKPPKIEVTSPSNGATYSGNGQSVIEVRGSTEEASEVYINDNRALLDAEGKFVQRYQLGEGENTLTIYAVDDAGNKSVEVVRKVTFTP